MSRSRACRFHTAALECLPGPARAPAVEHPSAHITWGECAANGSRSFTGYTLEQMHRAVRSHTSSVFEERLAAFWRKLRSGERVRVLTLGGSLTQGARMCCDSVTPWPVFLSRWLRHNFGQAQHIVDNWARGSMDTNRSGSCLASESRRLRPRRGGDGLERYGYRIQLPSDQRVRQGCNGAHRAARSRQK